MFQIVLQNEKVKKYKLIRELIILLNLPGFIFLLWNSKENMDKIWVIFGIVSSLFFLVFVFIERLYKKFVYDNWYRTLFLWNAFIWLRQFYWWVSIILLLFLLLDILAHRKMIVSFHKQYIIFPTFPKRKLKWNELNNVVLKDSLLTIDFENNKLFQQPILNSDWDFNEKDFNDFCKKQLNTASKTL